MGQSETRGLLMNPPPPDMDKHDHFHDPPPPLLATWFVNDPYVFSKEGHTYALQLFKQNITNSYGTQESIKPFLSVNSW